MGNLLNPNGIIFLTEKNLLILQYMKNLAFKIGKSVEPGVIDEIEEVEESPEAVLASDYAYLPSMVIGTFTLEQVQEFLADSDKLGEVDELRKATIEFLWEKHLDALEKQLDKVDKTDGRAEEERKELQSRAKHEAGTKVVSKRTPIDARKNEKKANNAGVC